MLRVCQVELMRFFKQPKSLGILACWQLLIGILFSWLISQYFQINQNFLAKTNSAYGITEDVFHPLFAWFVLLSLVFVPFLTSSVVAKERQQNTFQYYLLSPLSPQQTILGKYLFLLILMSVLILTTCLLPTVILAFGEIDLGHWFAASSGLMIFIACITAMSLSISTFCRSAIMAIVLCYAVFIGLSLLEWGFELLDLIELKHFSLLAPLKPWLGGKIQIFGLIYYGFWIYASLSIAMFRIKKEAYQS